MQHDYEQDWWINLSETEASDGLIMTFSDPKNGGLKGLIREIEVVEHRTDGDKIYDTLLKKISEKRYAPDTVLVCLILTEGIYNLENLSERLRATSLTFKHIFVVFSGIGIDDSTLPPESLRYSYSLVQLLPIFTRTSFDYRILVKDFDEKYKNGKEARSIEGKNIFFVTRNKKILSAKS